MPYSVYYRGEIQITPPLSEEHAAAVLAFSKKERNEFTEPIFARVAASEEPDLPGYSNLFVLSEDRSTILPDEDESDHGLRLWLVLLVQHYLEPLGYVLNGEVSWDSSDVDDRGCIFVKDNAVEAADDVVLNPGPSWSSDHYADERLKEILQDLVDSADDTGCSADLTVVSRKYVGYLQQALPKL
ncbi:hypothetical protein HNQ77_002242 [Silvibacterium bohemicum]|uniref:Uncharacterized protein n=1 Tax=Silvibacterium bohemicum TaxID=1577686 RepID=A0A841JT07_9BACT|nr:hypothetical protein [Silvibacterium bohemicum]MBB6144290.1 hypothetical protein [Silvibacterium bohemicum]